MRGDADLYRAALTAARTTANGLRQGERPDEVLPYDEVDELARLFP